jgi:medium-chain acyl-[acyl-carrier-protein] hydrolase
MRLLCGSQNVQKMWDMSLEIILNGDYIMEYDYMPQLREADENGYIGIRGYLNFFQDAATRHMHDFGKGNDTIPEQYGICWMYTKYRMHLVEETGFEHPVTINTWIEKMKTTAVTHQAIEITCNGKQTAIGRLESCLVDMKAGHLTKPSCIDFPENAAVDRQLQLEPFTRLPKNADGTNEVYRYVIRYTDTDKNRHMTNLRYVNLLMDAFDGAFYEDKILSDIELHYITQCFEGEEISVRKKSCDDGYIVMCVHSDGIVAAAAFMKFTQRKK